MTAMEPTSCPAFSDEAIEKAVKALLKWKDCQPNSEKPQLLSSDDFVYLVVTLKQIPAKSRTNPYKIPLVHPLYSPSGDGAELCLFLDDRPDRLPSSKDAKAKIASESIPIPKVIKLSKLKTDYKPFEAKRKLCDSYDLFLADRRIVPLLPKHIGKQFFKKKKIPVAVDLEHKNWKEQVDRICGSALLHVKTGTCSTVRVARASMAPAEIAENVSAAINGVAETVPRKWSNIRSLHLKLSDSVALPIYQSMPDVSGLLKEGALTSVAVNVPSPGKKRGREGEDVKKSPKASSKKGRIHQVRYMDDALEDKATAVTKSEDIVVELVEADVGKKSKKKKSKEEADELVETEGSKKKKLKKEANKGELGETDGGKKKKVKKAELVEADGVVKKVVKPVKADGAEKKKVKKVDVVEVDEAKKKAVKPDKSDGAEKKKVKDVAKKEELKSDGVDLKNKEKKVRKVSNVAKPGVAKKTKRS